MNSSMHNRRMAEKLAAGEAIDVSDCPRTEAGDYILAEFVEDVDYCNAKSEQWIWSIGRELATGEIHAAHSARLYQNPAYLCLWLR